MVLLFAPCFLGGVLAWRFAKAYHGPRLPGWAWPLAILAVSPIWMIAKPWDVDYCRGAFGLCLGLSIPFFREVPWRFIKDASRLVARYSYAIYLSHFPILMIVFRRLPRHGRLMHYSVLVALFVTVPLLLYHGVEAPGIRYGKKLAAWITRQQTVEVPKRLAVEPEPSFNRRAA